jgi:hypothetical protein
MAAPLAAPQAAVPVLAVPGIRCQAAQQLILVLRQAFQVTTAVIETFIA